MQCVVQEHERCCCGAALLDTQRASVHAIELQLQLELHDTGEELASAAGMRSVCKSVAARRQEQFTNSDRDAVRNTYYVLLVLCRW